MPRMYTEVGEQHRLYNGGDHFSEVLLYSLPDGHDIHCVARYQVTANERDFFKVPKYLLIGDAQVELKFLETLLRPDRYGPRCVVLVNAN